VLCDGESSKGPIECAAGLGDEPLVREGLQIHGPDPGHLVHRHESSLEGVVERGVSGVRDWEVANEVEALAEVGVPELVGSRQGLEGPLVDDGALMEWRVGSGDEVAPP